MYEEEASKTVKKHSLPARESQTKKKRTSEDSSERNYILIILIMIMTYILCIVIFINQEEVLKRIHKIYVDINGKTKRKEIH